MTNQIADFYANATPAEINGLVEPGSQSQKQSTQQTSPEAKLDLSSLSATQDQQGFGFPQQETQSLPPEDTADRHAESAPQLSSFSSSEPVETPAQMNFRKMREEKLRAEWERDELARRLSEYQKPAQQPHEQEEPLDLGIGDDDIVEGKTLAKIYKKIEEKVEKKLSKKFAQQQEVAHQQLIENRLKMEMPDIDVVVNSMNLAMLGQRFPEVAASVHANQDLYTKAKSAYTLIKQLGIVATTQPNSSDYQRIQQNLAKPKPVQAIQPRQSPLAEVDNYSGTLTKEMQQRYWEEMQKAMKG